MRARSWPGTVAASLSLLVVALSTAGAQAPITQLGTRPSCPACTIKVERLLALQSGVGGAPSIDRRPNSMAVDSRGRIFVTVDGSEHFFAFDRAGGSLGTVGTRGQGPGEFVSARDIAIATGDTLYVFDNRARRFSVFSPALRFVRSAFIPRVFTATVSHDGNVVVSGTVPDPGHAAKSFHLFDRVGNQRGSVGFTDASVIPGEYGLAVNLVAPAGGGGFWSVSYAGAYTIAKWSASGDLVSRFERNSELVGPGRSADIGFTRSRPTDPYIRSIREDVRGFIWVEIVVADRDWKRGLRFDEEAKGERALVPEIHDYDRVYDTVIEVIDPRTKSVVVSQRFDEVYSLLMNGGRISRPIVNPDGTFRVEIFSIRLTGLTK